MGKVAWVLSVGCLLVSDALSQEARLLRSTACADAGRKQSWGRNMAVLHPSPGGILKETTPYSAFGSGGYEVRVYGNPLTPAGVEIGIFGDLAADAAVKKQCLEFLSKLLTQAQDRKSLLSLALQGDRKDQAGMRFEIVAPQTPYEGWWAAAFDPRAVAAPASQVPGWIETTTSDDRSFYAPDPVAVEWKPRETASPDQVVVSGKEDGRPGAGAGGGTQIRGRIAPSCGR